MKVNESKVPAIIYAGPGKRRLPGFNLEHMLDRENAVDRARRGLEPCPTGAGKHRAVVS